MKDGEKAKKIRLRFDGWWKSGSQEGKVESRQKIWRAQVTRPRHIGDVTRWLGDWVTKCLGGKVTGLRVTWWQGDTIWFTGTVTRWQYEKVIRRHCDPIEYYWQRGVEFLFKFTVYLRIKLHSFIIELHIYNKRYILIKYQLMRKQTSSEFCQHFSFKSKKNKKIFLIEFLLLIFFFLRTKGNKNEHNFLNYFAGEYDS